MFIDSHCHLQNCFTDIESFNREIPAIASALLYFVDISTNGNDFLNLVRRSLPAGMLYSFGLDPEKTPFYTCGSSREFERIINLYKPCAIGETGLDYHINYGKPKEQEILFRDQIEISLKYDLPLIVHSRDAFFDTYRILSDYNFRKDVIIHCFGYGKEEAEKFLSMGFFISFAGNLTYPGSKGLRDAAAAVPLNSLLLETDSPYLAPLPVRGTANNPVNVIHTYRYLAEFLKIDLEELKTVILNNFEKIFCLG